ncbi:MAG TPA: c-type cytochrome [Nitriliruptorales bacterium]
MRAGRVRLHRIAVVGLGTLLAAVTLQAALGGRAGAQETEVDRGAGIWATQCALCHGELGRGMQDKGPDIRAAGTAAIDFVIRTGRMPLEDASNRVQRSEPHLTAAQRDAVLAFYDRAIRTGGPDIPRIEPRTADLARGRELFVQNCAACHGPTAAGIAVGQRDLAPSLDEASPIEIAEAVRIGPGRMPVFGTDIYTEDDVEAVTAWVLDLRERAAPGGAQVGRSGPVSEGAIAWIVGMGLLLLMIYLLGEHAQDPP